MTTELKNENVGDHSNRGHAEFSPSQLKSLKICPGYEGTNNTNPAAEAGTRIHEAMELRDPSALESDEERDCYDELIAAEDKLLVDFSKGERMTVYNEVVLDIEAGKHKTFGSCDKLVIVGRRGLMIDYKTGIGEIDEPAQNLQGKAYTLGAFQRFPDLVSIDFYFLVPKRDEILFDSFDRDDTQALENELEFVIGRATATRPLWAEGRQKAENLACTDICQFCKYTLSCPAVTDLAFTVAKGLCPDDLPENLDPEFIHHPEDLSKAFGITKVLDAWSRNVRTAAMAAAQGEGLPGYNVSSMGSPRSVLNTESLIGVIEPYGLTDEDLRGASKVSLTTLTRTLTDRLPRGAKKKSADAFQDALEEAGNIVRGEERFTLRKARK